MNHLYQKCLKYRLYLKRLLHLKYRGPHVIPCNAKFRKGDEMGWFQHGSTIIVFAPRGFAMNPAIREGHVIRAGQALMQLP